MKRFWHDSAVENAEDGWQVTLDGRPVKTRAGAPQVAPTKALADLLRGEWADAPGEFSADAFPLRDLADRAIDSIATDPAPIIDRLLSFADGDTLCYRAEPDEAVARRQAEVWEPIVAGIESDMGIALTRTHGIVHRPQPEASKSVLRERLERENAFTLAGLDAAASLAASLSVALAGLEDNADPASLWSAASLEEDWQAEQWGRDAEAQARRDSHEMEFTRALAFARAARSR